MKNKKSTWKLMGGYKNLWNQYGNLLDEYKKFTISTKSVKLI